MATVTSLTPSLPPAQEWKDVLEELLPPQGRWSEDEYLVLRADAYEEAGTYRRGESAVSTLLAGFSVAVAGVFDAD